MNENTKSKLRTFCYGLLKSGKASFSDDFNSDRFLSVSDSEFMGMIIDIQKEYQARKEKQQHLIKENKRIEEDFIKLIKDLDKDPNYFRRWKKSNGKFYAHWQKVIDDLKHPVFNYNAYHMPDYTSYSVEVKYKGQYTVVKGKLEDLYFKIKETIKAMVESVSKDDTIYKKSLAYIVEHDLDTTGCVTIKDHYRLANDHAEEAYREEILASGEVIDVTHGDGDDCEWEVGEHRCQCGNNRYYLEVEGDFINGFYSYGQWC